MASNLIRHYPSISKDEFKAACLSLEQRSQRVIDDPSWMGVRRVEKGDESALRVRKELSIALEEPYDDAPNASEADDDNDHVYHDASKRRITSLTLSRRPLSAFPVFTQFLSTFGLRYHQFMRCRSSGSKSLIYRPQHCRVLKLYTSIWFPIAIAHS